MSDQVQLDNRPIAAGEDDEGYMLLGLIVAIAMILLWLGAAASYEAFQIRRDREVETARRADQYVRAIRLYYKKFGHYPGSIDQLEKSNNIRFLRRRWIDPLTKTTDWRLISVGQNKTTVKGFFGEPLAGLPTSGLGALAGSKSAGMPGATAPTGTSPGGGILGGTSLGGVGAGIGTLGSPMSSTAAAPSGTSGASSDPTAGAGSGATAAAGTTSTGTTSGTAATGTATSGSGGGTGGTNSIFGSGNGLGGTNGALMGVGTNATGSSILIVNEQTDYQSWEFLYDPRLELLKQKQQLNQGLQTNGAGSFGQAPGFGSSGTPGSSTGTTGNGQPNPTGTAPGAAPTPTVGTPIQQ